MTDSQRKLLKAALIEACKDDFAHLPPEDEIDIVPSEKFEKKMQKLIRSEKRPYYVFFNSTLKKVAAIAIVLGICASAVTTVNIGAESMPEPKFYVRYQDGMTSIRFDEEIAEQAPDEILEYYVPSYVPKGYKLEEVNLSTRSTQDYKNKKGEEIRFKQIIIVPYGIFNDNYIEGQYLKVGDNAGLYYFDGTHNLEWSDGRYFYVLTADCSKNEFLRMAESVKLNENYEEEIIEMIRNKEIVR